MNRQSFFSLFSRFFKYCLIPFLLCFFLATPLSMAVPIETIPNPQRLYGGWVVDQAGILSPQTETKINRMIGKLEAQNGTEMVVVTVSDTLPYPTPKIFTTKLFNYWGIGKARKNNGILFMVSPSDRRVEIETGRGMQTILPDEVVKGIIDTQIIPQFKQKKYERGILAGSQALIDQVLKLDRLLPSPDDNRPWFVHIPVYIWTIGMLGIIWTSILTIWLLRQTSQSPTLAPHINIRLELKNDSLYLPLHKSKNITDEAEAFRYLKKYFCAESISPYLPIFYLSIALIAIALAYIANWTVLLSGWGNGLFILMGIVCFLGITLIGLFHKKYILIFYAFLISWGIFAVSLSGRNLTAGYLSLFLIWLYIINICMIIIKSNSGENNDEKKTKMTLLVYLSCQFLS
jgi:uncharacterized membrane protein YgcG